MSADPIPIDEVLDGKATCICAGPGGVGKTSTSAAIALGMARRGLQVAVLTIDPAKRLADSLGLGANGLDNQPRLVEGAVEGGEGELWAMMLDPKATFDDVVARYAEDDEARQRILGNRIYQQISGALAGSQEYMAMEKLYEIHESGRFDLLVLDTPPSRHALDFLDAPQRLVRFVEGRSIRLFLRPAGIGARIASRGTAAITSVLSKLTGVDLLADLTEFFTATSGMIAGLRERAQRVEALLADPATSFIVVSGPAPEPLSEATYLQEKLHESGLGLGAVVVNRVQGGAEEAAVRIPQDLESRLADVLGDDELATKVVAAYEERLAKTRRDAEAIARLRAADPSTPLMVVPELTEEITDLESLSALAEELFAGR